MNAEIDRRRVGAGSLLLIAIVLLVLIPLGLFTFEMWRYVSARIQLQHICDAAALGATASLLSQETATPSGQPNQWNQLNRPSLVSTSIAKTVEFIFEKNSIFGSPLSAPHLLPYQPMPNNVTVPGGETRIWLSLLDRKGHTVDPDQMDDAKGVRISVVYGYKTFCGSYLGLGDFPIAITSEGGIPRLDLVLCFDVSASMDDGTCITMIKRFWDGSRVSYAVPTAASGVLLDVVKPLTEGSHVNAVGPQNLSVASSPRNGSSLVFSESQGSGFNGLRATGGAGRASEAGFPPGNYNPANPSSTLINGRDPSQVSNIFTDIVTNLDGSPNFRGWTDPETGLQFPNVQTLVEASRGNLNSTSTMQQALASSVRPSYLPITAPNPLYQKTYFVQANRTVQPMVSGKRAATQILRALNRCTDLNSGLVSFANSVGTDKTSTWGQGAGETTYFVDSHWPPGGTGSYPLPLIKLNPSNPNVVGYHIDGCFDWKRLDHWICPPAVAQVLPPPPPAAAIPTMSQVISGFVATGQSNIAAALEEAISQLSDRALTRPDSEKIVLLISDGHPSLPGGGGGPGSPAAQSAYNQARIAKQKGIRIIAIDVATTSDTDHSQFLSEVASLSKGYYSSGAGSAQLNTALKQILTQLVALK